ncbi:hypothetical protein [Neoroseomonas rubea]|nr:hypothetical protein [Roseomonas rubea]
MTITTQSPRATPARGTATPASKSPRPGTGLSPAEIRQIVLDILG